MMTMLRFCCDQGYSAVIVTVTAMDDTAAPSPRVAARSLESIGPILLFLALNRLVGLRWAVAGATLWSLKLVVDRRRRNQSLGVFLPVITAGLIARGLIAVIADSETVYFGLGIGAKFAVAVAAFGSVLIGRPLANLGAPHFLGVDTAVTGHPEWRTAMSAITGIGGLYYLLSGAVDIALFQRNSVEGFVLWRFLANWPLSVAALVAIAGVAQWRLNRIPGIDSVGELIEARLEELMPSDSSKTTETS